MSGDRYQGTLIHWNIPRAFGFVVPDSKIDVIDAGDDLFVHISAFGEHDQDHIVRGCRVSFIVAKNSRSDKLQAASVRIVR
jgi:cold shock CspA family protein